MAVRKKCDEKRGGYPVQLWTDPLKPKPGLSGSPATRPPTTEPLLEKREKWRTRFEVSAMWSILWNGFHICKSFKSCSIKSCYRPPTKPRNAPSKTVQRWCATPCGNISAGWNCEPVKSATARATRDGRKPTRKRGVGKRRRCGRKNNARRSSALPVCRAGQKTTGPRADPQQCHRVFIHSHGCACYFYHSRRAIGSGSE